jgi:L-threonylcarbamoyladenylate synthase
VSALFPSIEAAKEFVQWNTRAEALAEKYLPGPLTLILPLRRSAHPLFPTPEGGKTVGVRISPHPIASSLALLFGEPLSTTSANLHGKPNPYSVADLAEQFDHQPVQPDLILDSGILPPTPPSTVLDLTGKAGGGILRQGEVE